MDWPSPHSILAMARPDGSRRGGEDRKVPTSTTDAADFCDSGDLDVPTAKDFVNGREHACRAGLRRQPTTTTPWRRSRQTAGWDCSTKSRAGAVPRQLIIACTQSMLRQVSNTTPGMPSAAPSTRARSLHHDRIERLGKPVRVAGHRHWRNKAARRQPCRSPRAHCEPDAAWDPVLWRPCHCEFQGRRLRDRALDCLEDLHLRNLGRTPSQ